MMRAVPEIPPTRQKLLERCFLLLWLILSPGLASAVDWQMRYHEGNYGALTTELRAHLNSNAEDATAWLWLARTLRANTILDEAQLAAQRAVELDDGTAIMGLAELAALALLKRQSDDARRHANSALSRLENLTQAPDAAMLRAAASAAQVLGREDIDALRTAVDLLNRAREIEDGIEASLDLAALLLDKYNNEEASEIVRQAVEAEPENPRALLMLARSQHFDHLPQTKETLSRVLALQPRNVAAHALFARVLLDEEDYPAAEGLLRNALTIEPRSLPALSLMAGLKYLKGRIQTAQKIADDVRATAPGYASLFITMSELLERTRRYRQAVEFALIALGVDRLDWRAHALLGINRLRIGQERLGRRTLEQAFAGDPFNVRVKNSLTLLDEMDRDYERRRTRHFILVAHSDEIDVLAPLALPLAERAYEFYTERYGEAPPTPIQIEFFPTHEDFSVRTAGVVGIGILGVSFGPVIAMDSPSAGHSGPLNWASILWHEIAHSFHLAISKHKMPRWFSEGLAVYEEKQAYPGWGGDLTPAFVTAYAQGKLPKVSKLNDVFVRPTSPNSIVHGYFQGSMFIDFVVREYGFDAIRRMLKGFGEDIPFERLVKTATGVDADTLDEGFAVYMRDSLASAVYALGLQQSDIAANDDEKELPAGGPYRRLLNNADKAHEADDKHLAMQLLDVAMRMFPEYAEEDSAYWLLATLEREEGRKSAAAATLEMMLAVNADSEKAHRVLADIYAELGDQHAHSRTLERLLYVQPFSAKTHQSLAASYEAQARWEKAVHAHQAALAIGVKDGVAGRYNLARAQLRAADEVGARNSILRALEQAPMYEEGLDLLLQIRAAAAANQSPDKTRKDK